jgi:FkbH-like protein
MAEQPVAPAVIHFRLRALPFEQKLVAATAMIAGIEREFNLEAAKALLEALTTETNEEESALACAWAEKLQPSIPSRYLQAKLLHRAGRAAEAAERWQQFFSLYPCRDPFTILEWTRLLVELGRFPEAALQLRQALSYRPPYSFYPRAAKLINKIWQKHPPSLRRTRIAVLGSSTTSMLIPVLRALCFRDGIDAEFYEGLYGAFRQEILDPQSALQQFQPHIVFLATNWRDLNLPSVSSNETEIIARLAGEYETMWRTLAERFKCHVVQHSFDLPAQDAYEYLSESLPGGRARITRLLNLHLAREAPPFVSVLDIASVIDEVGINQWADPALWSIAKQHPSAEALPQLAELQLAHVRAVTGLTRKVLVCDLDNTLWGGVIGEEGLQGIQIGSGSPIGEAYQQLQGYLLELKSRGILLAVCSKNNLADAQLPFQEHEQMLLRLNDFVAFFANWDDKVANLKALARTLSLGTDSFVFMDDNPVERAWVRSQMPEVEVVELGATPFTYVRDLHRGRYFYALTLSEEDRERSELYRSESARETARSSARSLEEFLAGLHMQAQMSPVSTQNISRVTQLLNKTNQFNLTTRRHTQAHIEQLARRDDAWTGVFQLSDRFGDHGIIGVMLCAPVEEAETWEIDTWLMSCRVLGRQMENYMLHQLLQAAHTAGIKRLIGIYRPTAKNAQVSQLYERFGFREVSTGEEKCYELLLSSDNSTPTPHHILHST